MLEKKKTRGEVAAEAYMNTTTAKESHDATEYAAAWEAAAQAVVNDFPVGELLILLKQKSQRAKTVYAGLGREWAVFITEIEKLQAWHYSWLDEHGEKP